MYKNLKFKVICIKDYKYSYETQPLFSIGYIYDCKYTKWDSKHKKNDYMEVRRKDNKYTNACGNPKLAELKSYFIKLKDFSTLIYYKKRFNIFKIIISKFTNIKFEDKYKKIKHEYKNIDENLFKKIYKIISVIHTIEDSEFYIYHQDKIKYILDSLIEVYKVSNEDDFDKHVTDCISLLSKITEAINIAESKVKEQDDKNKKQMMAKYSKKKEKLFKIWNTELNELWEVKNK